MVETLPSGLRLLVDVLPQATATSVQIWVDAGSCDEAPHEEGAAHFVEHMLFKGTSRRPLGAVAAEVEGIGGDINAYTSFDHSVYHATVPGQAWPQALDVLADMLQCSIFDEEEVQREREVILDELRGGRDDPDLVLNEAVIAQVFPRHPYGRPIGGSPRAVASLSAQTLRDFWRAHYAPERLVLSISGDVDPVLAQAQAQALFPERPAGAPRVWPEPEPAQIRRRSVVKQGAFEEPLLEFAFRACADSHPDAPAMELLAAVLSEGSSSQLGGLLQVQRRLASSTWGAFEGERQGGYLSLGFSPLRGRTLEAVTAFAEGLREIAAGGLSGAVMQRARARLLSEALAETESPESRAWRRAFHLVHDGDPMAWLRDRAALEALTPARLRAVAADTLKLQGLTLGALLPEGEADPSSLREAVDHALKAPRALAPRPTLHRELLPNGLTLVVEEVDAAPVAALRLVGLGGQLTETPALAGAAELWGRCLGGGPWTSQASSERAELRGLDLGTFSGRNSQGLRVDGAADRIGDGLEMLAELLCAPRFDADERERAVAELLEEEALLPDNPSELAWREALRLLYGPHPYGLPPRGDARSLARLNPAALLRFHRRFTAPENLVLAAAGPIDLGQLRGEVLRLLGGLRPQGQPLRPRPQARWPRRTQRRHLVNDREQTHLVFVWPGSRFTDPDTDALSLAASVLGGQGGRLFMELRDRRGLAYHVSAENNEAWDVGSFSVSMAMDPDRAQEAAAGLHAEVQRLAAQGPEADELRRVKASVLGMMALSRQRVGARALDLALWERYGRPAGSSRAIAEARVQAVTAEDLRRALSARVTCPGVEVQVGPAGDPP